MNPSYEYMRRIRREEQSKLLGLRRERATKALDGLTLHGDSLAMLSQIAYAIHPHVGAWDAESCDHLRNVLTELIGDACEAASCIESHIPCGASGCHSGDEQKEVADGMAGGSSGMREDSGVGACWRMDYSDVHQEVVGYPFTQYDVLGNERHKAVCELSSISVGELANKYDYVDIYPEFIWAVGQAIGLRRGAGFEDIVSRLIHLLDDEQVDYFYVSCDCFDPALPASDPSEVHIVGNMGDNDQSHDSSPMGQGNETGSYGHSRTCPESDGEVSESAPSVSITDELREYVRIHETATMVYATMPPQTEEEPTRNGERLLAIADEIDRRTEAMAHQVETWRNRAEDMCIECDELQVKLGELQASLDELSTQNDMLRDKLDELSTSGASELYKLLKRTVGDAKQIADKLNAHNGMLKQSERLRRENAKCAADAINKACMYLDLLRDAAMDYKALQDRLNHMVEVCQIYTEANA